MREIERNATINQQEVTEEGGREEGREIYNKCYNKSKTSIQYGGTHASMQPFVKDV